MSSLNHSQFKRHTSMKYCICIISLVLIASCRGTVEKAKDNGDIYVVSEEKFLREHQFIIEKEYITTEESIVSSTPSHLDANIIDFDRVIATCNSSFSIPMDHYRTFNTTAELPDVVDKTGMCFLRCLYEKSGLLENWKLDTTKIRLNIWPATGDSIEVCEMEGANEKNPCVRAYDIAKCLTIRALVDARNQPL
ncbi:general odorant-binding protein 84a-like [Musca domestica]|uniref:General odorant-binding protein 84a-like n=1 Tax=Musca domestica TaxID=7370 RepID=A0ABM3VDV0_MUSDO|nr:general odorant-binding protein 84a-like [Musca domestica]